MRVGQTRKRDGNEALIVAGLEQYGASVIRLSDAGAPDLIVFFRGRLFLLEVKSRLGRATPAQTEKALTGWPVSVIRSLDEALKALGVEARL